MPTWIHAFVLGALLFELPLMAQIAERVSSGGRIAKDAAEPPVPSDPLELVTGGAQPVLDVEQRAAMIDLLVNAHRHSNVRAQPYDLKTIFTVSGSLSSGQWQEEDASPSAGHYRWTVQSPSYSAVNMTVNRIFYSSQPVAALPLRLIQFREAIFYSEPVVGPHATLRTAPGALNGVDLVCALVARDATAPPGTGGRLWEEEEYCVDPKAGVLVTYSQAPGSYVLYDYSKALQFHGKSIPNGFTITQAGQNVIEAQTESLTDPVNNSAEFQTAGLNRIGVGPAMSRAWRYQVNMPLPGTAPGAASPNATSQVVMLHGMQAPSGELSDVELLASSDASLNQPSLAYASKWSGGMLGQEPETGATPQSHEILMMIEYSNAPPPVLPPQ